MTLRWTGYASGWLCNLPWNFFRSVEWSIFDGVMTGFAVAIDIFRSGALAPAAAVHLSSSTVEMRMIGLPLIHSC